MILIFLLFIGWYTFNAPSAEEIERQKFVQDSIAAAQVIESAPDEAIAAEPTITTPEQDSIQRLQFLSANMGFEGARTGPGKRVSIENDVIRITFDEQGGKITEVFLKEYDVLTVDSAGQDVRYPVTLLDNPNNQFYYEIPLVNGTKLRTNRLHHTITKSGNTVTLTAKSTSGATLTQTFSLTPGSYTMDYNVEVNGMDDILDKEVGFIELNWKDHLNILEKNVSFERMYSTVYFQESDESTDYCSCRGDDEETLNKSIKWVSHANQFFSSTLIADKVFGAGQFATISDNDSKTVLKTLTTKLALPIADASNSSFDMQFYSGPNDFNKLKQLGHSVTDVIPYGWSIFGGINRWIIRPLFEFLASFIGSMGIVILILTLIVKSLVFPLTYRMLYSQSKMAALKPVTAELKEKYKDDQQKIQMETMKVYREYGVNPAGGCFPMLLQMPIWFALYRFFPASIEFRQASFLWANDLSSYDSIMQLPFSIPMLGSHLSGFTLLWMISLLFYTWYNMRLNLDMSANMNPMMKNMQFIMPIMFFVFLNQYAAGLTCYLLFSNLFNIGQNVGTKKFLIDEEKIKNTLRANKEKPKKKSGFQARLEKALEEQKKIQEDRQNKSNRKR